MFNITRRQFLTYVGAAGGSSALLKTSLALGLTPESSYDGPIKVQPAATGKTPTALILGAGISGLATALELERAGYECTILEASFRPGGRNLTVRHGDKIDEMGRPQICNFDKQENLYLNCGPARIPGHHRRVLHYCKTLNVPLQVKANSSKMAYFHDEKSLGGKPKRIVEYHTDVRGLMSELLWKAADNGQYDQLLSEEDVAKLISFSKVYGDLTENGKYRGSERAGSVTDRMMEYPTPNVPIELKAMLDSSFWYGGLLGAEQYDWCEPLMEPVGGMDSIVKGFLRNVKTKPILNAQVKKIYNKKDGVEVTYQEGGVFKTIKADYCFNNIPSYFMAGIENNFDSAYQKALNSFKRGHLFKIGFQMKERFWERDGIYGGISYSTGPINQIWYPSHDIHAQKGVILGAYSWQEKTVKMFEALSHEDRLKVAIANAEKIHPEYGKYIESGISIPWARMNYQMGCGSRMPAEVWDENFALLQKPEGRHFMIGDQISHHTAWQEGALASSEQALQQLNKMIGLSASKQGVIHAS